MFVHSEVGKGSRFTVELPQEPAASAAADELRRPHSWFEDVLPMRTLLFDCLAAQGFRVLPANDGAAGLEKSSAQKPDFILLDVMMPRVDGSVLFAELRRHILAPTVLMLTAKDRVHGLDCWADDFLSKPFSRDELLDRIPALLRRTNQQMRAPPQISPEQSIPSHNVGSLGLSVEELLNRFVPNQPIWLGKTWKQTDRNSTRGATKAQE